MPNKSAALAGAKNGSAAWTKAGVPSLASVEEQLYALVALCVYLLELETDNEAISRRHPPLSDLEIKAAIAMRQEETLLRKMVSITRKRLIRPEE
jgi:hypothetical protein